MAQFSTQFEGDYHRPQNTTFAYTELENNWFSITSCTVVAKVLQFILAQDNRF